MTFERVSNGSENIAFAAMFACSICARREFALMAGAVIWGDVVCQPALSRRRWAAQVRCVCSEDEEVAEGWRSFRDAVA